MIQKHAVGRILIPRHINLSSPEVDLADPNRISCYERLMKREFDKFMSRNQELLKEEGPSFFDALNEQLKLYRLEEWVIKQ